MVAMARTLRAWGWTLRTGHAAGADQAFELGADDAAEVYLPWSSFEADTRVMAAERHARPTATAYGIAANFHPAWSRLSRGAQALHARNVHEVLGVNCDEPSVALVCWTPGGTGAGGTGQAIRIAGAYGVPVFDLGVPGNIAGMMRHMVTLTERRGM